MSCDQCAHCADTDTFVGTIGSKFAGPLEIPEFASLTALRMSVVAQDPATVRVVLGSLRNVRILRSLARDALLTDECLTSPSRSSAWQLLQRTAP